VVACGGGGATAASNGGLINAGDGDGVPLSRLGFDGRCSD
jgi:hypothetical protein